MALTDHDTLSGVKEAQAEGQRLGVEVIAGVEISVTFEPGTMHILGYFVDPNCPELKTGLEDIQEARRQRNPMIIKQLNAMGIDITLAEVEKVSGGDQVGRPHFARVLKEKGHVTSFEEAFDKYLGKGKPGYVDKRKLSSKEAFDMIKQSGGIASLAHPKLMKLDSKPREFEAVIERLRSEGMSGLEVYSSCQNAKEAAFYKKVADRMGLVTTGGSDFHGANKPDVKFGWMGDGVSIPYETVDQMKQMILERKK